MRDQTNEIVALDPRHPLQARAERAAETEFERRQQPREEAAVAPNHKPDAQSADPHAMRFGSSRRLLPGLAEIVAEAAMRLGGFGQRLILPQTIPADRRTVDQYARLAIEACDQPHDVAG